MSSLEPRNENDLIAVRAGINVRYPGLSEYGDKVGSDKENKKLEASRELIVNHSIRNDLIKNHNIRLNKYSKEGIIENKVNFSITGNSEQRVRYVLNETSQYKKIPITRKDFSKNPYFDNLPKFTEKSEYATSFTFDKPIGQIHSDVELNINPKQSVLSAARGRPLASKVVPEERETITRYKEIHTWPGQEKRDIFEWTLPLNNSK